MDLQAILKANLNPGPILKANLNPGPDFGPDSDAPIRVRVRLRLRKLTSTLVLTLALIPMHPDPNFDPNPWTGLIDAHVDPQATLMIHPLLSHVLICHSNDK